MNATPQSKRPLSPHLQVYRLPYNALMSIGGRMVGIGLAVTMIIACLWFISVIFSPEIYEQTGEFLSMPIVKYGFLAWAFAIIFYLGNGIRHFLWNIGVGVDQKTGILTGNIVLIASVLVTIALWYITMNDAKNISEAMKAVVEATNE